MFSLRNKKDIGSFRMKKMPYLLLCDQGYICSLMSSAASIDYVKDYTNANIKDKTFLCQSMQNP